MQHYHVSYLIIPKNKHVKRLADIPVEVLGNTCFTIKDLSKPWIPDLIEQILEDTNRPNDAVWILNVNKID